MVMPSGFRRGMNRTTENAAGRVSFWYVGGEVEVEQLFLTRTVIGSV